MARRPTLLLANDDGVEAPGLAALARALAPLGRIFIVAPDRERSAASHALTLHRPLRLARLAPRTWSLDGTPTDCISFAIKGFLRLRPDLVVSGINRGANLGDDVIYSGTVSAAIEAALLGYPAIAVSLAAPFNHGGRARLHYGTAAGVARRVARAVLRRGLPAETMLNVNVPNLPAARLGRLRVTRLGKRRWSDVFEERSDPRGKKYYWVGGDPRGFAPIGDSDFLAVEKKSVSVTPLSYDMTRHSFLAELRQWRW